jgi:hypothetical protein
MNQGAVFLNDFVLLEARLAVMRERQLVKCCPKCMQDEQQDSVCPVCRPRSSFPSAFSSQAEWDSEEQETPIDIPLLASKISLIAKHPAAIPKTNK